MFVPALMDELVEETLIRIPPDDPARLVRAALVCKRWCRLISSAGFRRRFREFHGRPPMLGFLYNAVMSSDFVRTSPTCPPLSDHHHRVIIDARHGRVLLHNRASESWINPLDSAFVVWDPITGEQKVLPLLPDITKVRSWNAAVLCADTPNGTCDHLDCHRGPFFVILVGLGRGEAFAYAYSSEASVWSKLNSMHGASYLGFPLLPCALVGNALYFEFLMELRTGIMKYDLGTCDISVIDLPPDCFFSLIVLMTTEDGGLGFAQVEKFTLNLWSREAGSDGYTGWTRSKFIELKTLLPVGARSNDVYVVGCADDIGVIFLSTSDGIFTIDLKSVKVTKVCEEDGINIIFPYMSFYTPAFEAASTAEEPRSDSSSA